MISILSKNIIYNVLGQAAVLVLGFIAVKSIFGNLGADVLGILYFTAMTNALLTKALDLGVSATTMREVSSHGKDEPEYIHELIRTSSLFYWGAYGVFAVALYFVVPFFVENWINLRSLDSGMAIHVMRWLAVTAFLALPESLYISVIKGLQRMEYNNLVTVIFAVFRQAGTILILGLGGNIFHVVYLYAASYCLPLIAYLVVLSKFFHPRAFIPGYFSNAFKRNVGFASKLTLQTIMLATYRQLDKLIISKLMPIGVLGYYSFAYSNLNRATIIQRSIAQAAFPSFCESFGASDKKSLLTRYKKLQDMLCFFNVPIFALIPFALLPIFSYTFNEQVAQQLHLPATLLCIGFYLAGTLRLSQIVANAMGKPEINVKSNAYSLLIILPLTVALIYFWGLPGAGLAVIFRWLFHYAYAVPKYCSDCLEMPAIEWYGHILKIVVLAGLTYGLAWLTITIIGSYSILSLANAYLSATVLFILGSYQMIGAELRSALLRNLRLLRIKLLAGRSPDRHLSFTHKS